MRLLALSRASASASRRMPEARARRRRIEQRLDDELTIARRKRQHFMSTDCRLRLFLRALPDEVAHRQAAQIGGVLIERLLLARQAHVDSIQGSHDVVSSRLLALRDNCTENRRTIQLPVSAAL